MIFFHPNKHRMRYNILWKMHAFCVLNRDTLTQNNNNNNSIVVFHVHFQNDYDYVYVYNHHFNMRIIIRT